MTGNPSDAGERMAVLIPCLDEEATVGRVVTDFRQAFPGADVYVFDNGSSDRTADVARAAGATVVSSPRPGKGNVVRHMFRTVEADLYVLVDGDGTYPAAHAPALVQALRQSGAEMVVGTRLADHDRKAFRPLHRLGNRMITRLIGTLFSAHLTDVLSGYRVLSRDLVRALQLRSTGFEIETEMTLQCLVRHRTMVEVPIAYASRPPGSRSKLSTFTDGLHIGRVIVLIFRDYKPLPFFMTLGGVCLVAGILAGWRPIADYVEARYVRHVPLALLAAALEILAVLFGGIGLVLDSLARFHLDTLESIEALRREPAPRDAGRAARHETAPGD
jgi:hypothetical protein